LATASMSWWAATLARPWKVDVSVAGPTPSQTIGPFFRFGMDWMEQDLVAPGDTGAVTVSGRVIDGAGAPVPDALLEIWQADGLGRFPPECEPGWTGFGRCLSDADGEFSFTTVKPGPLDRQAPHIDVSVFARGLLQRLVTRIYFPDEEAANQHDAVLRSVPDDARISLIAVPGRGGLRFDVHLQGERETAFFAY
jgi:protocatechuate 3,4-dioxygenase, alpha subunit